MNSGIKSLTGLICTCFAFFLTSDLCSQPFVDPIQVRYMYAFKSNKPIATPFSHLWVGSDVPIFLNEDSTSYLLLSPFFEQWRIDSAGTDESYPLLQSFVFPAGVAFPLNAKWALTVVPLVRWNGEDLFKENTFQFGGATFVAYARKPKQKFRLGVYMNAEFFGLYVVPLFGADWKIDQKNYLFGILPGRMTFEHQWTTRFYGGVTYRSITNSYRLSNGEYIRLDDNQISLFIDYYLAKHLCITIEPGFGLIRKFRTGIDSKDYIIDEKWGDGPFIKLSTSYRFRK